MKTQSPFGAQNHCGSPELVETQERLRRGLVLRTVPDRLEMDIARAARRVETGACSLSPAGTSNGTLLALAAAVLICFGGFWWLESTRGLSNRKAQPAGDDDEEKSAKPIEKTYDLVPLIEAARKNPKVLYRLFPEARPWEEGREHRATRDNQVDEAAPGKGHEGMDSPATPPDLRMAERIHEIVGKLERVCPEASWALKGKSIVSKGRSTAHKETAHLLKNLALTGPAGQKSLVLNWDFRIHDLSLKATRDLVSGLRGRKAENGFLRMASGQAARAAKVASAKGKAVVVPKLSVLPRQNAHVSLRGKQRNFIAGYEQIKGVFDPLVRSYTLGLRIHCQTWPLLTKDTFLVCLETCRRKQLSREMKTFKGAELKAWLGGKEAVWKGIQLSWEEVGLHETRGPVFGCLRSGEGMLAVYPMVKPCKTSGLRKLPIAGVGRAFFPPLSKKSIVPARLPAEGPSVKSVKDTCMLLIGSMTVIDFEKGDEESL